MENVTSNHSNHEVDPVVGTFARGEEVGSRSLWGFLGPAREDMYRLYTDVSFTKFYEIPQAAIVWVESGEAEDDLAPATVHLSEGTRLDVVETGAASAEGSYLDGAISAGYLQNQGTEAQLACGNVLTTAVCTLAGQQQGNDAVVPAALGAHARPGGDHGRIVQTVESRIAGHQNALGLAPIGDE